jgi:hypothetical protein
MMYMFTSQKFSIKNTLHNVSVFAHTFAIYVYVFIIIIRYSISIITSSTSFIYIINQLSAINARMFPIVHNTLQIKNRHSTFCQSYLERGGLPQSNGSISANKKPLNSLDNTIIPRYYNVVEVI